MLRRAGFLLLLLGCACIERPGTPRSLAARVDRSKLSDVILTAAPAVAHPVGAVFNGEIELIGYDVTPEPAAPGQTVRVTFYWRALDDVNDDWQVFVHLEDELRRAPRRIADHWPAGGRYHTSAWRQGDIVKDAWTFVAPRDEARVAVWTGFYIDNLRLTLSQPGRGIGDGENRLRVGTIELR